jgi:hypothetical protein
MVVAVSIDDDDDGVMRRMIKTNHRIIDGFPVDKSSKLCCT